MHKMRKAELGTIATAVILAIISSIASFYAEKEYNVTLHFEKSFCSEEVKVKPYPDIIITDKQNML